MQGDRSVQFNGEYGETLRFTNSQGHLDFVLHLNSVWFKILKGEGRE